MRKLTLTLSDKDYEAIQEFAKQRERAKTDIVLEGLSLAKRYDAALAEGSKILIESPDGKTRELELVRL